MKRDKPNRRRSRRHMMPLLAAAFFFSTVSHFAQARDFDENTALRLIWSTMIGIQQANDSGNYSVFRDIAAPGFQAANNPAQLTQLFSGIRDSATDLSHTLMITPEYEIAPQVRDDGLLRMRGRFVMRPKPINFDLLYQQVKGQWRLVGVAVISGDPR